MQAAAASGQQLAKAEPSGCGCAPDAEAGDEVPADGPDCAYTHLGSAPTVDALRRSLETRLRLSDPRELRIEKVAHTAREGASEHGCPVAKWVIRRSGDREKVLALVRERPGHDCPAAVIVVAIVSWEAVPRTLADQLLEYLPPELSRNGFPSERRCAANDTRTCGCQGFDENSSGASYSFGCSWSMFHNACKFARTKENARKFRLRSADSEAEIGNSLNSLADVVGQVFAELAPDAFETHTRHSEVAADCRLGRETPPAQRPFSGVTVCLDFCAHAHKDNFLIDGGCSAFVTLNRRSEDGDEQLHVLPSYVLQDADSAEGPVETLTSFPKVTRVRAVPLAPCTSRKKSKRPPVARSAPKEENSPASIDSGFESIKSNHSPGKEELRHHSPPAVVYSPLPPASPALPPIASWFRKSSVAWPPRQPEPQAQFQRPVDLLTPGVGEYQPQPQPLHLPPPPPPSMEQELQYHPHQARHPQYHPQPYHPQPYLYSYTRFPEHCAYPHHQPPYQQWRQQMYCAPFRGYSIQQQQQQQFQQQQQQQQQMQYEQQLMYRPQYQLYSRHAPMSSPAAGAGAEQLPARNPLTAATENGCPDRAAGKRSASESEKQPNQEYLCDNAKVFEDSDIGGVALALTHGSVLLEASKVETHATTALKQPDRGSPTSVNLVFHLHKNLCFQRHGFEEYAEKLRLLRQRKQQQQQQLAAETPPPATA